MADEGVQTFTGRVVELQQGVLPQIVQGDELLLGDCDRLEAHGGLESESDAELAFGAFDSDQFGKGFSDLAVF